MKPTLLLLNNAYAPTIGGVENSLRHIAEEASLSGWHVIIVVSDIGVQPEPCPRNVEYVLDGGVSLLRYPLQPVAWLGPLNLPLSAVMKYWILRRLQAQYPDAVVISRFHLSTVLASLAGLRRLAYLVPSVIRHQYGIETEDKPLGRLIGGQLKRGMHSFLQKMALRIGIVFVFSNTMRQQCSAIVGSVGADIRVCKPGVDPRRFHAIGPGEKLELREKLDLPVDKKLVLFAGRFVKAKGVEVMIAAMKSLPPDVELVLVGEGAEEATYRQLITQQANAKDRFHLRPATSEVEDYYRCCDVFAMTSLYEPFGQTILEALASGLPVVAFSSEAGVMTATEELGFDGFIELVDRRDPNALAAGILRQLEMPDIRRVEQSNKALATYSWKTLTDELTAAASAL